MAKVKVQRFWKDQAGSVIAFAPVGRPTFESIARECNAEGKFLNESAALAFAQNQARQSDGVDKLTKGEMVVEIRSLRERVASLTAERDALLEAVDALESGDVDGDDTVDFESDSDEFDTDDGVDADSEDDDSDEVEAAA